MDVATVMARSVLTCRPEDSLSNAAKIMWEHDCGSVPVVDETGKAIAMITDRDICMAAYTRDRPLSSMTVSSVCTKGLVAIRENDTIESAEQQMQRHQIRRLPVTDVAGKPIGMLSLGDLARSVRRSPGGDSMADGVLATLAAIASPPKTAAQRR